MSMLKSFPIAVAALLVSSALFAADKPSARVPASAPSGDALIFAAPPRETAQEGARIYQPVTEYLSKIIGKRVVYKHPPTWGVYRTEMLMNTYDIVFDGPQFNGYRVQRLNHNMIAKLPAVREMYIFVRKNEKLASVSELAGRTICTQVPPNLDGLVALLPFENEVASRQPVIVPVKGREAIYKGVVSGNCSGGVLPSVDWNTFDKGGVVTRVVFKSQTVLDQAFSAGPRVSRGDQAKMTAALISPEASGPTENLRTKYRGGDRLVAATNAEYAALAKLLRHEWGFSDAQ